MSLEIIESKTENVIKTIIKYILFAAVLAYGIYSLSIKFGNPHYTETQVLIKSLGGEVD